MSGIFEKLVFYFQYPFVWYALIVGVLIALCSSLLGVTLVLKRFSFIGDGLSHVAFGAMAIASVLNFSNNMLFVMPVTERLLTQPNRAMDKEFPFAIEHHIPVLPLMQESGLEEKFQKRFGDMQFLDANAHDSTAIPFEKKLQKFLDSVLVGDELAAQVRAAVYAYIFIS